MKNYLLIICLFVSFTAFGKKIYTLPKEDFIKQFNDSASIDRVYCYNEQGNKVWLAFTILIAKFNDNKEKKLMFESIRYKLGEIQAIEETIWGASKIKKYKINDIKSFTIEGNNLDERPYFDMDSLRALNALKNDSIKKLYSVGNEYVVLLTLPNKRKKDTLLIMENACYHMKFKNNEETMFGVVHKITKDSIVISNTFNPNIADFYKKAFINYHLPISDIREIKLLKTHGYGFRTIKTADVPMEIIERKKEAQNRPMWYSFDVLLGEIFFCRVWFVDGNRYHAIAEQKGKPVSF